MLFFQPLAHPLYDNMHCKKSIAENINPCPTVRYKRIATKKNLLKEMIEEAPKSRVENNLGKLAADDADMKTLAELHAGEN